MHPQSESARGILGIRVQREPLRFHQPLLGSSRLLQAILIPSICILGCGGGDGSGMAPEQKAKQVVVQDKMKEFMQKSNLPTKPR